MEDQSFNKCIGIEYVSLFIDLLVKQVFFYILSGKSFINGKRNWPSVGRSRGWCLKLKKAKHKISPLNENHLKYIIFYF